MTQQDGPSLSLRTRVFRGSAWSLTGYSSEILLRFGSNLLFTRLLSPQAYGLMALTTVFMIGLHMCSDLGLFQVVIRDPRGEERSFLNTVWVAQIVRGSLLTLLALLIAWPISLLYDQPFLFPLIAVSGLTAVIDGFVSTRVPYLNRKLQLSRLTLLNIGSTGLKILTVLIWALISPTVWAFVAGSLINVLAFSVFSYYLPGPSNAFEWDRTAWRSIYQFGRWLLFSSILGFFASQVDRLSLGFVFTANELGVYSIALFFSQGFVDVQRRLASQVLLPAYSEIQKEALHEMRRKIFKIRGTILAVALPSLCLLSLIARPVVAFLYDPRYLQAGWMLQLLAIGAMATIMMDSLDQMLLAIGNSLRFMLYLLARFTLTALFTLGGYWVYGTIGAIFGIALAPFACYSILILFIHRYRIWMPWFDLPLLASFACIAAIGIAITGLG